MPTIIGQEVPPGYTGRPRRISSEDLSLWDVFRTRDFIHPTRLLFDVGVGGGKPPGANLDPTWQDYWLRETQRRIDVLVIEERRQIIIELRKRALANALGRLIVYRTLYAEDPLSQLPLETWIVTDTLDPELQELFAAHEIRWITL